MPILNVFIGALLTINMTLLQLISFTKIDQSKHLNVTIFISSQVDLNGIIYSAIYNAQFLIKAISSKTYQLQLFKVLCILQWLPGFSKIFGNVKTHKLAQKVTLPEYITLSFKNFILLLSTILEIASITISALDLKALFTNVKVGRIIKSFNKVLLGKYTKTIYNRYSKKRAKILCQLYNRISTINLYLVKMYVVYLGKCKYN